MAINTAWHRMTICEKIRMVNDLCQTDSQKDKAARKLLVEIEEQAKLMSSACIKWKKQTGEMTGIEIESYNEDYEEDLKRRTNAKYKVG